MENCPLCCCWRLSLSFKFLLLYFTVFELKLSSSSFLLLFVNRCSHLCSPFIFIFTEYLLHPFALSLECSLRWNEQRTLSSRVCVTHACHSSHGEARNRLQEAVLSSGVCFSGLRQLSQRGQGTAYGRQFSPPVCASQDWGRCQACLVQVPSPAESAIVNYWSVRSNSYAILLIVFCLHICFSLVSFLV